MSATTTRARDVRFLAVEPGRISLHGVALTDAEYANAACDCRADEASGRNTADFGGYFLRTGGIRMLTTGMVFIAAAVFILVRNEFVFRTRMAFIEDPSLYPAQYRRLPTYNRMMYDPSHWMRWTKSHWPAWLGKEATC